jgi:hypothetical protein
MVFLLLLLGTRYLMPFRYLHRSMQESYFE